MSLKMLKINRTYMWIKITQIWLTNYVMRIQATINITSIATNMYIPHDQLSYLDYTKYADVFTKHI